HTQRSSSRKSERRLLPAECPPAAVVSEVFVDETPKGLVLLRLPRLDVKSKPDPNCEDDHVYWDEEVRETEGACDEAEVLDQQEQDDRLPDERDDRCQHGAPPVNLIAVVQPEITQDRKRYQGLNGEDDDDTHDRHQAVQLEVSLRVCIVAAAEDRKQHDDDRRDDRLSDRCDVRALIPRVCLAECLGQDSL